MITGVQVEVFSQLLLSQNCCRLWPLQPRVCLALRCSPRSSRAGNDRGRGAAKKIIWPVSLQKCQGEGAGMEEIRVLIHIPRPAQWDLGKLGGQDLCMTKYVNCQTPFSLFFFFFLQCTFEECPNIETLAQKEFYPKNL